MLFIWVTGVLQVVIPTILIVNLVIGRGGKKDVERYDIFNTLKENFDWINDGCAPVNHGFESVESEDVPPHRSESGDSISDSRSTLSSLPCDWTRTGCASGGNCNNINCLNSDGTCSQDYQSSINDVSPPPEGFSHLIQGKRIRISGGFQTYNKTQDECKSLLLSYGAIEVKMGTTFGEADILIAGRKCRQALLADAKERGKLVLTYPELINSLQLEGYSITLTKNNTTSDIDESELVTKFINSSQFLLVDGASNQKLKGVCRSALPAELSKVYDNEGLVVETAETEFTDRLLLMKRNNNKKQRPMRFSVTRIKQNNASGWKYYYRFDHKIGQTWIPYCVAHDVQEDYCSVCNGCNHVDQVRGIGYPFAQLQCITCYPKIACMNCGIEPRTYQNKYEEQYKNYCARCYRIATEGMTSEDRSVEYIRDSNIPISSANKYVFGLPFRPDAEITASPNNDISYEHDDKKGHVCLTTYPAHEQHQRTVDLNKFRPKKKGKVTIRQHPLDITDTVRQKSQNALMVSVIKKYMNDDLGQRSDRGGGKRIIVFIGHSCGNYHYEKAVEEKKNGYWDEVILLCPYNSTRDFLDLNYRLRYTLSTFGKFIGMSIKYSQLKSMKTFNE